MTASHFVRFLGVVAAVMALVPAAAKAQSREARVDARVDEILGKLTLDEKIGLLSGTGFDSRPVPRLGIPGLHMSDGPVGVRTGKSTAWPASVSTAASFDPGLVERIGAAIGRETKAKGKNVILGPCVNIHREPQGGRNFESYGEDPYLASRVAVAYIKGVQGEGVVATVKHFAANNQESDRTTIDVQADERTLQEIYLPHFGAAVQEADVQAVMCSYNKLNGPWACESPWLLTDVLRRQWGFRGLVMSDWGATHSVAKALNAGLDLEMPDGRFLNPANVKKALAAGEVKQATIDEAVRRQLRIQVALGWLDRPLDKGALDTPGHRALNREAAAAGMVLLKNDRGILPLDRARLKTIAVLGPNAATARTGGGGSALVEPIYSVSPLEGIKAKVGAAVRVEYAPGATFPGDLTPVPASALRPPAGRTEKEGLLGEYFDNPEFEGRPAFERVDPQVKFIWAEGGPKPGFKVDDFSVRWTGRIAAPETGRYSLGVASDDGSRLYLDGRLIVDNWGQHGLLMKSAAVDLKAGESHDLKIEMYELEGDAGAVLSWQRVEGDPIDLAVGKAKAADLALLFVGHTSDIETEGVDRGTLELPEDQVRLIQAVAGANPNTVVVLNSGAAVLMGSWPGSVPAVLESWFAGSETGNAVADVLFGDVNPSGRLPTTFPTRWEDAAAYGSFPGAHGVVRYGEGIFVGYRWFDKKSIAPEFPFGYGLSYTRFAYRDLSVAPLAGEPRQYEARFFVKNTGGRDGAEVAQLYVHGAISGIERPVQVLKGFQKVALKPGEEKEVRLALDDSSLACYDAAKKAWVVEPGDYQVRVGASSRDIRLEATFTVR